MKKHMILLAALLAAGAATAQDDISKQLEVTKAYTPNVGRAAKIAVEPSAADTVQLRPDIEYSIIPTAWQTSFGTARYRPASISVTPYEKHRPLYLRAGIGYPVQSTADLYFNPYTGNGSTLGFFFNHRGMYQPIKNDVGAKNNSLEMLNGGGLYGAKQIRRRILDGDLEYDNRVYHPYAEFPRDPATAEGTIEVPNRFAYGRVRGSVGFGDTFTDLDRFNFRVGLDAAFSHEGRGYNQADISFEAAIGQMFRGKHGFELGLYGHGSTGTGSLSDYGSSVFMLKPRYLLSAGKFNMKAGLDIFYWGSRYFGSNDAGIAVPLVEMSLDIASGRFSPYIKLTNHMVDGSFEALSRENPYLAPGEVAPTGWIYDARIGFNGNVNGIFQYNFYGAASRLRNYHTFFNLHSMLTDDRVMFATAVDNGVKFAAGGEMGLMRLSGFSATLSGNWYGFSFKNLPTAAGDAPDFDAALELSYSRPDRFSIKAGVRLIGPRGFLDMTGDEASGFSLEASRVGTVADVSLGGEFRISDGFSVFVEANNLANQKLYPYHHYSGLGANVMAGIKIVF